MKNKIRFLFLVIFIISLIVMAGCLGPGVIVEKAETIDLSLGITVGNHTYLPLNLKGNGEDNVQDILQVLDAFEKANPELEVTSWAIQESESVGLTYGLWVNHRHK